MARPHTTSVGACARYHDCVRAAVRADDRSQRELAGLVGVHPANLSQWLSGRPGRLSDRRVDRLAALVGVDFLDAVSD